MGNRKKRYLLTIVIILIFFFVGGYFLYPLIVGKESNQKYRTVKVERGEISSLVTATGTINPVVTVLVGSQISGTIKALYADFNSRVKEGEVIAQIDPAILEAQVEQAKANVLGAQSNLMNSRANLQSVQANLVKAEVAVEDTKKTLNRNNELMKMSAIAQSALDTAQANYDSAVAQRNAVKAQIRGCQSPDRIRSGSSRARQGRLENVRDQLEVYHHPLPGQWDCDIKECGCGPDRGSQPPGPNPFYHC